MNDTEIVHVMLKPDTLERCIRDSVLEDLIAIGGRIILSKKIVLNYEQISEIYPNFKNARAKSTVFKYFTSYETEHLAFVGEKGIHKKYQASKGRPGAGGIRGKYYTKYTELSPSDLDLWLAGLGTNLEDIDLEMFGYDILHVPDSPKHSQRGLIAVFGDHYLLALNGVTKNEK